MKGSKPVPAPQRAASGSSLEPLMGALELSVGLERRWLKARPAAQ